MNKKIIKNNLKLLIISGYLIIFLSFFGNMFYFFDLFSHFYLQYFSIGLIILFFSIYLKEKIFIIFCIILLIFLGININKSEILHYKKVSDIDIYYLNANYGINKPKEIINDIKKYNPKTIIIVELNNELEENIIKEFKFKEDYYYNNGYSSFGIFTNEKFEKKLYNSSYPIGEFEINNIGIFVIHPFPPFNYEFSKLQIKNFEDVKLLFDKSKLSRKIIIGDFNSSFYSSIFKKYFGGYYYKPIYSWNNNTILGIPIDYAIGNNNFFNIYSNNSNISDHSPLLIKFKD